MNDCVLSIIANCRAGNVTGREERIRSLNPTCRSNLISHPEVERCLLLMVVENSQWEILLVLLALVKDEILQVGPSELQQVFEDTAESFLDLSSAKGRFRELVMQHNLYGNGFLGEAPTLKIMPEELHLGDTEKHMFLDLLREFSILCVGLSKPQFGSESSLLMVAVSLRDASFVDCLLESGVIAHDWLFFCQLWKEEPFPEGLLHCDSFLEKCRVIGPGSLANYFVANDFPVICEALLNQDVLDLRVWPNLFTSLLGTVIHCSSPSVLKILILQGQFKAPDVAQVLLAVNCEPKNLTDAKSSLNTEIRNLLVDFFGILPAAIAHSICVDNPSFFVVFKARLMSREEIKDKIQQFEDQLFSCNALIDPRQRSTLQKKLGNFSKSHIFEQSDSRFWYRVNDELKKVGQPTVEPVGIDDGQVVARHIANLKPAVFLLLETMIDIGLSVDGLLLEIDVFLILAAITSIVGFVANLYIIWSSANPFKAYSNPGSISLLVLVLLTDLSDSLFISGSQPNDRIGPLVAAILPLVAPAVDIMMVSLCSLKASCSNLVVVQCLGSAVIIMIHAFSLSACDMVWWLGNFENVTNDSKTMPHLWPEQSFALFSLMLLSMVLSAEVTHYVLDPQKCLGTVPRLL